MFCDLSRYRTSCRLAVSSAELGSSIGVSLLMLLGSNSGRLNFFVTFCFKNNSSGVWNVKSRFKAKRRSEQEKSFFRPGSQSLFLPAASPQ